MNKAIETMCERCVNHEECQGTGCGPKRTLEEAEQKLTEITKYIEQLYCHGKGKTIDQIVDDFYCENCPRKGKDCPVEEDDGYCPVTNEESFKYFMENYFKE